MAGVLRLGQLALRLPGTGSRRAALLEQLAILDAPSCDLCLSPMEDSGSAEGAHWSCPWCGSVGADLL